MSALQRLSASEQIADHLRAELARGQWSGTMPGVIRLADELGVARNSVEAALRQLEGEGILVSQGPGRRRLIGHPGGKALRSMRVAILLSEISDRKLDYIIELQHALVEAGHTTLFPGKTLNDLRMNEARLARLVQNTEANAWVVAGGSRGVLEYFAAQPLPAFALFGRLDGLSLAGIKPDKSPAYAAATRSLIALGHRRIVLLARKMRRLPAPGRSERAFLEELASHRLPVGEFNLPGWEETRDGFQKLLASLFKVTPPSALIIQETPFYHATLQFLASRGIRVPGDVSLLCADPDPSFDWCEPRVAHIHWDSGPVVRRIVRWAAAVSRGRRDVRQTFVPAEFVAGGTVGPAPKR